MRKLLIFASVLLTVMSACSRQSSLSELSQADSKVRIRVSIPDMLTKATSDGDGRGTSVNRWVVEVRDAADPERVVCRQVKSSAAGALEQTFELYLINNKSYDLAFWADTDGCYDVNDLSSVAFVSQIGNEDKYDAFCSCIHLFTCIGDENLSAVLTRPLAQVNFIATDLKMLEELVNPDAYILYEPEDLAFTLISASKYDVFAGSAISGSFSERTIYAPAMYGHFCPAPEKSTLFMTYIFTDNDDVKDVSLNFKSNSQDLALDVTNVPFKPNYRTNIIGGFFSGNVTFTVEIEPEWNSPDFEYSK